ncbi:MAG: hypothetical protein KOO62_01705 [candidate division Zixibacteria bacterium]|nr:hypothetical protein [candidate division Zixibacteria bacterium]
MQFHIVLDFVENAWAPESLSDLLIWDIVFVFIVLFIVLKYRIISRTSTSYYRFAEFAAAGVIAHCILVVSVIPYTQRFEDDQVGILFPRFSGIEMGDNLGDIRLNEALGDEIAARLLELEDKMDLVSIADMVQVRSVSWVVESEEQSDALREKYKAKAILWGSVRKQQSDYMVSANFIGDVTAFGMELSWFPPDTVKYYICSGPIFGDEPYRLSFSDTLPDQIASFARKVINNVLPDMAIAVQAKDPVLAARIIEMLPSLDPWYTRSDQAPFLLSAAAQWWLSEDSVEKAMEYFSLSYEFFKTLLARIESGETEIAEYATVNRFAVYAKYMEGATAYRLRDTARAKECRIKSYEQADLAMLVSLFGKLVPLSEGNDEEVRQFFERESKNWSEEFMKPDASSTPGIGNEAAEE